MVQRLPKIERTEFDPATRRLLPTLPLSDVDEDGAGVRIILFHLARVEHGAGLGVAKDDPASRSPRFIGSRLRDERQVVVLSVEPFDDPERYASILITDPTDRLREIVINARLATEGVVGHIPWRLYRTRR